MKLFILSLLFSVIHFSLFAQSNNLVKNKLSSLNPHNINDSILFKQNALKIIHSAKQIKDYATISRVYLQWSKLMDNSYNAELRKKFEDAAVYYAFKTKDLKLKNRMKILLLRDLSDKNIEKSLNQLLNEALRNKWQENTMLIYGKKGRVLTNKQEFEDALKYFNKALAISEELNQIEDQAYYFNCIGNVFHILDKQKASLQSLQKAIFLYEKLENKKNIILIKSNIANVKIALGDIDSAIKDFQTVIKLDENKHTLSLHNNIMLGKTYNMKENYKKAIPQLEIALSLAIERKDTVHQSLSYYYLANSYLGLKNYQKTAEMISNGKHFDVPQMRTDFIDLLWQMYEGKNAYKEAHQFHKLYVKMTDSIRKLSDQENLVRLESQFNKKILVDSLKIISLNKLNTENQLKFTKQNFRLFVYLGSSLFILVLVITGILYLRKINKQKNHFTNELLAQIESQRSRISMDLHDDIGQQLSFLKTKFDLFALGKIDNIGDVSSSISNVLHGVRSISHQLYPAVLDKLGLEDALQNLIEDVNDKTQLKINLNTSKNLKLNSLIETNIYRIIQECLNNTVKHAQAQNVMIKIKVGKDKLTLDYQDDGKGFLGKHKSGIGLMTITERVRQLKGKISLMRLQNGGFYCNVKIPLQIDISKAT